MTYTGSVSLRSHSRRVSVLCLAALFVVALVEAAHHRATSIHGFCSEHGRQIHLERLPRVSTSATETIRRDVHIHGAHDCAFLGFLAQSRTVQVTRAPVTPKVVPAPRPPSPTVGPVPRTIALFRLSPSHSPPCA